MGATPVARLRQLQWETPQQLTCASTAQQKAAAKPATTYQLSAWHMKCKNGQSPDVGAPGVDVDEGRLDVDSPGPDGQTLSPHFHNIGLDVDSCCSHVKATGRNADDAGVVVDSNSLHKQQRPGCCTAATVI